MPYFHKPIEQDQVPLKLALCVKLTKESEWKVSLSRWVDCRNVTGGYGKDKDGYWTTWLIWDRHSDARVMGWSKDERAAEIKGNLAKFVAQEEVDTFKLECWESIKPKLGAE